MWWWIIGGILLFSITVGEIFRWAYFAASLNNMKKEVQEEIERLRAEYKKE